MVKILNYSQRKVSIVYRAVLWIVIDLMSIRIRISMLMSIKTMPVLIRALPQVLHMLENQNIFLNFYFYSQHCQFTNFLEKVNLINFFICFVLKPSDRLDPDRHALDANPDLDPDPAK